jgi:hypothetical protein
VFTNTITLAEFRLAGGHNGYARWWNNIEVETPWSVYLTTGIVSLVSNLHDKQSARR